MPLHAQRYYPIIEYINKFYCENILEIGVCKGDTSIEMLNYSKNKNVKYYGVDLFEDMEEHVFKNEVSIPANTMSEVESFLKSVSQNVKLFKGFSNKIFDEVKALNIKFDLIFIDGGHSYETVKSDFENYSELLNDNGIIFFDDYTEEPGFGIKQYVDELSKNKNFLVMIIESDKYTDLYRGYKFQTAVVRKRKNDE